MSHPGATASTTDGGAAGVSAVLTWPNLLSAVRLAGVAPFLWLLLGPHADGWALAVLMVSGFTDWADGALARKLNQTSALGALLDPAADRLYILAALGGLLARNIVPLWLVLVILARDLALLMTLPTLRRFGLSALPVHYLGKAATFNLLYAFPFLLVGSHPSALGTVAKPIAWAFTIWGAALYLWAGALYLLQVRRISTALSSGTAPSSGTALAPDTARGTGVAPDTARGTGVAPDTARGTGVAPDTARGTGVAREI